jgi:hypothetical protein
VTDPRRFHSNHLAPLEPWAIELLREGSQKHPDLHAAEELERLVALLRSLPDPEPPSDLARNVLDYVAAEEARPRVVRWISTVRAMRSPGSALALAAAASVLLAIALSPRSFDSIMRRGAEPTEIAALAPRTPALGMTSHAARRRSVPTVAPQFVSAVFAQAPAAAPRLRLDRAPMEDAFALRLDSQLNQLMIDPTAFAQRLERIAQREQFIARLAARAAERGDAPEIALRVRRSPHPVASQLVDRLLHATLVASISQR